MPNETTAEMKAVNWTARQVYAMAVVCLIVGLAIGYLFRGSQSTVPARHMPAAQSAPAAGKSGHMPSLDEMKLMADKKAAPLLEKLKADPNNSGVMIQIGNIYKMTHQFKQAAEFYDKALQVDPKNVTIRTEMASCMYYQGDVDGALSQLQQSLKYDPKDANSLFNLGMIRWQGKKDSSGALAAWQELLKANPQLSADRKAAVQNLMADVRTHAKS